MATVGDLTFMPEGIYFDMPEEDYFADPSLSQSSMKWLLVSPMDYWARSAMNPDRPDDDTSDAMDLGKGYHARILEGRDVFYDRFAAAVDPDDYPDALRTVDEIKAALKERELPVSGNKPALIDRLLEADPQADIWDRIVAEHAEKHDGKTLLPPEQMRRIEIAAAMIEKHPQLSKAFTGGEPEVSIFWRDDEYGTPLKARIDYLKVAAICDLKSFANKLNKPIDRAVVQAVSSQRYHIQTAHYDAAIERAREFVMEGRVFGPAPAWIDKFAAFPRENRQFLFVFQQTGVAPVARGYVMPRGSVYEIGRMVARKCIREWREHMDTFGTDPWIDMTEVSEFEDDAFPVWAMEV
ncbi:MAG: PD-(D/E)XK nuclease-like domain-containing protein [Pseudomonadota bacterium]|nr:PD-(D/E)XK nuclease-like domain-containing protein [Pseudomonadota bacterium]